jgi:hypothetical protein
MMDVRDAGCARMPIEKMLRDRVNPFIAEEIEPWAAQQSE